jgi:hypothetical protein
MPCDHIAAGAMHFESNEGCKYSLRPREKCLRDSTNDLRHRLLSLRQIAILDWHKLHITACAI